MSLRVDLTGNGTGFQQVLNSAKAQAKAFSSSVEQQVSSSWGGIGRSFAAGIAGAFSVQGVKSGLEWFINTGKQIKDQAEQVDMSADSWQRWAKAVGDADLSVDGLIRVLETLRQKRTDALTDPKARGELSRLGFSDAEITGGMDMGEFTSRALANANGGDLQRKYLADIVGNRGLKYSTALGNLPGAKADFSPEDLKDADEAAKAIKHGQSILGRAGTQVVDFARFAYHLFTWSQKDWNLDAMKRGRTLGKYADPELLKLQMQTAAAAAKTGVSNSATVAESVKDPMDSKLAAQRDELALHEQQRNQRILDSQRSLMTIGNRRASILGEMPGLQAQFAAHTAKMKGEDFLTDAQRDELSGVTGKSRTFAVNALRAKFQDDTDDLAIRLNKDRGDLREKPLSFNGDTMSKVGLYSASSVAFNPVLQATQKTNQLLGEIVKNTRPPGGKTPAQRDPFSP